MAELPKTIGRYEVQREIGRGSMGVVYQARDPALLRTVALKTISLAFAVAEEERAAFEKRFLQEARAAAGLSHPCIVVVYDVGSDPATGLLYMSLEYLRGKTLEGIVAQGQRLDWREALRATGRLADGLHHAHERGIVHRDIKPANIMVLASGEPKIMDFGVARVEASRLTTGNKVLGSPPYMSPEQADGAALNGRSDIFSLGAVLYELLTGKKAFGGPDLVTILTRLAEHTPEPPSRSVPDLPAEVDAIVARALAKLPGARYPTAKALAQDIEGVLAGRPTRDAAPRGATQNRPVAQPSAAAPPSSTLAPAELVGDRTVRAGLGHGALSFPPGKRVSLGFLSGPRKGEVLVLRRPSVLIGRAGGGPDIEVEVPDPEVSRGHAVFECHGSRMVLRDLGSRNGTFVANERVGEREMEDRGEFRVGATSLMVILSELE
jgi:serine/threonine protein kinase